MALFDYQKTNSKDCSYVNENSDPVSFQQFRDGDAFQSDWIELTESKILCLEAKWQKITNPQIRHTHIMVQFDDLTRGEFVRKRDKGAAAEGEALKMQCPVDKKKKFRIFIYPTGEFISLTPTQLSVRVC